ncbi:MAG: cell division protein SepF [Candidatus Bathyarchaeota archaeon]|nr:cell division protein SepF [Candidatus Bathyarchaeota archaeon]
MPNAGVFDETEKNEETEMEQEPQETSNESAQPEQPETVESEQAIEQTEPQTEEAETKIYLKAMPLKDIADLEKIEKEVQNGNILILKITPLANKNILDVSRAVNELYNFAEEIGGDIARLGEERIVLCPPKIRIWREKTPAQDKPVPTAA